MVDKTLQVERSATGQPVMSAGGGAFTKTYLAKTVLAPSPEGYKLKQASFIKVSGHLASSTEQAIIPVQVNDIVITLSGTLPITDQNPDATITAYRIMSITDQTATVEPITITHAEIPESVILGAGKWHNRLGAFFCYQPQQEV